MPQLPNEVLWHIFFLLKREASSIDDGDDERLNIKTLTSISRANKTFNILSAPALYHTLNLRYSRSQYSLRRFLTVIIKRPERAAMLRELQVSSWQTQASLDNGIIRVHERATRIERDLCLSAAGSAPLPSKLKWRLIRELQNSVDDAELALLLLLCPKLEVLYFGVGIDTGESLVSAVILEAARSTAPSETSVLSRVRELRVAHCHADGTTGLHHVASLLQLPSLNVVRGWAMSCLGQNKSVIPTGVTSASVKAIRLQDAIVDAAGISSILQAFPHLEKLVVSWGDTVFGTCQIHYEKIGDAFRHHGQHLQKVVIRDEFWTNVEEDEESDRPIGSLQTLTSLRHLTVPCKALFGSYAPGLHDDEQGFSAPFVRLQLNEMLPHSLTTLTITDEYKGCEQELARQVEKLTTDLAFDKLKSVKINRVERFLDDSEAPSSSAESIESKRLEVLVESKARSGY